ncbi:MAG: 4Fe-4S dicluster domain-containing protein [Candidatus Thorarchaeota archaeon]
MKKTEPEDKSRRNFIKTLLLGTGVTIIGGSLLSLGKSSNLSIASDQKKNSTDQSNTNKKVPDDPNRHWGFVIDLSKCDGCANLDPPPDDSTGERPRCSYACRTSHYYLNSNPPQHWIRVYHLQDNQYTPPYYFPKPCQNCQDPPCEHVCPTGATFIRKDGTVLINQKICIGCRICMAACPYETRFFWFNDPPEIKGTENITYSPEFPVPHTRGTVSKCDLCVHLAYDGKLPHCVEACPKGALYYGDLNEDAVSNGHEVLQLSNVIESKGAYRYKEEEGTQTSVFYIPPGPRNNNSNGA